MQDKSTIHESKEEESKLYKDSAVYALVNEKMRNIAAIQAKYPIDGSLKKNKPHEMASDMILIFTKIVTKATKLVSYFDNHQSPAILHYPYLGLLGLKIEAHEKKILKLKKKIDLNPHPMYIEFLQVLASVFEQLPPKFKDLIPFIDPSFINFDIGEENYVKDLAAYQEMILGTLESHRKMNDLNVNFKAVTVATSDSDGETLPEEQWVNFEPVEERRAPLATTEITSSIKDSIGQTLWAKPEARKPTSDCTTIHTLGH